MEGQMQDFRKLCQRIELFGEGESLANFFERFALGEVFDLKMVIGQRPSEDDETETVSVYADRTLSVRILKITAVELVNCFDVTIKTAGSMPFGFLPGTFAMRFGPCGTCQEFPVEMLLDENAEVRISVKELPVMDL